MKLKHKFPLQEHNSFSVKTTCRTIYYPKTISELEQLPDLSKANFYILGDGSNTLFVDESAPIIIKAEFSGIEVLEMKNNYEVTVGASENWHNLVCFCLDNGIYGLENLALIPGSAGAAPVQNIGAYGVELADFCIQVKWFEFSKKRMHTINSDNCKFAYRNSIFKQELYNKGIITEVVFSFPKKWKPNLSYAGLDELNFDVNPRQVMEKVIELRSAKLPDPNELPNAGSFFKNPIVDKQKLNSLRKSFPDIPFYSQENGLSKLAAGWLIEQAGLKGYRIDCVGVHDRQALVLVNYCSEVGKDILLLAKYVQQQVLLKFDVLLSPEVRMITAQGEQAFTNIKLTHECE